MNKEDIKVIKNMTDVELERRYKNLFAKKNLLKPYVEQYQATDYELSYIKDEIDLRHANKDISGKFFFNNTDDNYIYVAACYYAHNTPYCKCLVAERGKTIEDNGVYWDNLYINNEYKEITQEVFMSQLEEILNNSLYHAGISVTLQKEENPCQN